MEQITFMKTIIAKDSYKEKYDIGNIKVCHLEAVLDEPEQPASEPAARQAAAKSAATDFFFMVVLLKINVV